MSPPSKTDKVEVQGATARRSTRLAIAIPITFSGKDASGNSFKENSRTIVVNKHGAKIATTHQMALGAEVEVENRALGLTTRAAVVWVSESRSPQNYFEVGIQLIRADNIWGIQFPPGDWQEGPPAATGGPKAEKAVPPQTPHPPPTSAPPPAPAKAPSAPAQGGAKAAAPPAKAAPLRTGAPPSPAQITAELDKMLQRFTRQAEGISGQQTKVLQDNLESLSRQFVTQTQSLLREATTQAEENAANAKRALEDAVRALEERLQSSRVEVETLTSALGELQKLAGVETEMALQNIHEAGWQALEAATEELAERIKKELDTTSADFINEARKRIQQEALSAAESFRGEAETHLKAVAEENLAKCDSELQARRAQTAERAKIQVSEAIETATGQCLEGLKAQSQTLAADFEKSLQRVLMESREKSAQEAVEDLRRNAQELKAALDHDFQEQIAEARNLLKEEIRNSWNGLAEDARRQLMTMATGTAESMNAAAASGLEEFRNRLQKSVQNVQDKSSRKLEEDLANLAERHSADLMIRLEGMNSEMEEKLLTELRGKADASLRESAQSLEQHQAAIKQQRVEAEEFVARSLAEFHDKIGAESLQAAQAQTEREEILKRFEAQADEAARNRFAELETRVQAAIQSAGETQQQGQEALKRLQQETLESLGKAAAEITSTFGSAVKEATETVDKHIGSGAMFLKELESKAKDQLEAHSQKIEAASKSSTDVFSGQFERLAADGLNKLRQDVDTLLARSRKQLDEATAAYQNQVMQEAQAKLAYVTERLAEDSAAQLTTLTQENLEMAQAMLDEAKEKVVNESEDAFRARLAEVIAPALKPNDRRSKPRLNSEPPPDKS